MHRNALQGQCTPWGGPPGACKATAPRQDSGSLSPQGQTMCFQGGHPGVGDTEPRIFGQLR